MLQLHRGPEGNDGVIWFCTKEPGQDGSPWNERVAGIRADQVATIFPEFAEDLFQATNLYHTINTFHPGKPRKAEFARYLCSAFADFDCYDAGLSQGQALDLLITAQDEGKIPPVSMYCRSGQGVWAFWFLRGTQGQGPVAVDRETRTEYANLQKHLQQSILYHLPETGLDKHSKDIPRVSRVGGSQHPSGEMVEYLLASSPEHPGPRLYTMPELRELILAPPKPLKVRTRSHNEYTPPPRTKPRARSTGEVAQKSGLLTRPAMIAGEIHQLARARNGFKEGTRNFALWHMAWALCNSNLSSDEVWAQCHELGRRWCDPPYPDSQIKSAIRSAQKHRDPRYGPANVTIAGNLKVTPQEVEVLGLYHLDPHFVTDRKRNRTRPKRAHERRQLIPELILKLEGQHPKSWGAVMLRDALEDRGFGGERGGKLSHVTILGDLKALGIETPQQKRNRERREAEQQQNDLLIL